MAPMLKRPQTRTVDAQALVLSAGCVQGRQGGLRQLLVKAEPAAKHIEMAHTSAAP